MTVDPTPRWIEWPEGKLGPFQQIELWIKSPAFNSPITGVGQFLTCLTILENIPATWLEPIRTQLKQAQIFLFSKEDAEALETLAMKLGDERIDYFMSLARQFKKAHLAQDMETAVALYRVIRQHWAHTTGETIFENDVEPPLGIDGTLLEPIPVVLQPIPFPCIFVPHNDTPSVYALTLLEQNPTVGPSVLWHYGRFLLPDTGIEVGMTFPRPEPDNIRGGFTVHNQALGIGVTLTKDNAWYEFEIDRAQQLNQFARDTVIRESIATLAAGKKAISRLETQLFRKKLSKTHPGRQVPESFYYLKLPTEFKAREKYIKDLTAGVRKLLFRHDRKAHLRMKIARGPLPLDADVHAKLTKRKYTIITEGQAPDNVANELLRRNQPLRLPGEWIAYLPIQVRHTTVGDDSLPYRKGVNVLPEIEVDVDLSELFEVA